MINLLLAVIYMAFISLGLPDSLLGSAWPAMNIDFNVPLSYAGIISMIIAAGTIVSSLQSDRLTRKLGTAKVTIISVAMTAIALLGFSLTKTFWILCLWAIPYGLGAGSVDAALNNYVAINYSSKHMNWLHCMWGVGATLGPYLMGYALLNNRGWSAGYQYVAIIQIILTAFLVFSLPLWKQKSNNEKLAEISKSEPITLKKLIKIPGAIEVMICFFAYCAIEQTTILWISTYFTDQGLTPEKAATFASLFFIGITVGRAVSGFLSIKLDDAKMIRLGQFLIGLGIIIMLLPNRDLIYIGLLFIGLGCAPIYPSIIHSTPSHFGADKSQAIIGVEMASAYVGTCLMPPLFGVIADLVSVKLLPFYLLIILVLMIVMHEILNRKAPLKN